MAGLAYHSTGISRVLINGQPASVQPDVQTGATRWTGRVTSEEARRDVEIVAYPVQGSPIVRLQKPDGTSQTLARPSGDASSLFGTPRELRVSLSGLPAADRSALRAQLPAWGMVVTESGAALRVRSSDGAYLVVGADGVVRHKIGPSQTQLTELGDALVGEYGALQLAQLAAPAGAFGLDASFEGEKWRFRVGEAIEFRVRTASPGFLTVLDLGTNGQLALLYPSEFDDARVGAGAEIQLPTAALRDHSDPSVPPYRAGEPVGHGAVRVFVTERPLRLEPGMRALRWDDVAKALEDVSRDGGRWSTRLLEYEIIP
ncbi:MAG TPA: DUF4384 domain-containing protein [Longimicrobium sp.]|nr:DUF4384 domain-containing protein [Longimicrobium sp.]